MLHVYSRPVVPGCAGCAMAHPDFGRSVNPISTRGDKLCLPNYYWHTRIFRLSDGPAMNKESQRPPTYVHITAQQLPERPDDCLKTVLAWVVPKPSLSRFWVAQCYFFDLLYLRDNTLKVSQSRNKIVERKLLPKTEPGQYPECISLVFWEKLRLDNFVSTSKIMRMKMSGQTGWILTLEFQT